mgnify:CR=1 FL=1
MKKRDLIIGAFLSRFPVGKDNITKGDIFKAAKMMDKSISPATVGWIIYLLLEKKLGYMIKTGKGKNGENLYKRIK